MPPLLRFRWADILCCLLLQGVLLAGGQLLSTWTFTDQPCCVPPQAL